MDDVEKDVEAVAALLASPSKVGFIRTLGGLSTKGFSIRGGGSIGGGVGGGGGNCALSCFRSQYFPKFFFSDPQKK